MLQLTNIRKSYVTGDFTQVALDDVSVNFRDNEFVAILGPSGSGKTTMLNIIGGLDHYDSGDLTIDGVSTKEYKDRDWDTYRNNRIGFVFQSYNLIPHQTVLSNVEMALTLSGVGREERHKRALEALERVGLADHVNKKPAQMSGGQMQRVAIARALINNPEILLADEPTGALDSKTSVQIMDLLTEIAKDRLVVMVTHNPELAEQYATRIVNLADGKITSDSNPFVPAPEDFRQSTKTIRRASMSFFTALSLSFNNLMTKKGRTIMTAFAGSIGIIGIAAILSLSTGVNAYINSIEEQTLSEYPVQINANGFSMTTMLSGMTDSSDGGDGSSSSSNSVGVRGVVSNIAKSVGNNDLKSLKAYLDSDESGIKNCSKAVEYSYGITPLVYNSDTSTKVHQANPNTALSSVYSSSASSMFSSSSSSTMSSNVFNQLPSDKSLYIDSYDVVAGHWPEAANEVVLVTGSTGKTTDFVLYSMGLLNPDDLTDAIKSMMAGEDVVINETRTDVSYDEILGVTFKMVNRADLYQYDSTYNVWVDKSDDTSFLKQAVDNGQTLKVVGIVSEKKDAKGAMLTSGIAYTPELTTQMINYAANSDIVKQQLANPDVDVFSGKTFDEEEEASKNASFDMSSLFSIDNSALSSAFKMDTGSLSGMSSLSSSSVSIPDVGSEAQNVIKDAITSSATKLAPTFVTSLATALQDGSMPQPDASSLSQTEQLQVTQKFMTYVAGNFTTDAATVFATEDAGYVAAYMGAVLSGSTAPTVAEYLSTPAAQAVVDSAFANAIDCSDLSAEATAVVNSYMTTQLKPFIVSQLQTTLDSSDMKDVLLGATGKINLTMMSTVSALSSTMQTMSSAMSQLSSSLSNSMSIDTSAFANAFQFNMDSNSLSELITSMMSSESATCKTNLTSLSYADWNDPTSISIYPKDFEAKDQVINILDDYNNRMKDLGEDSKVITYTDIVGALMSSVTTIINAITTMLIAFVAISLVVSSIMIGIITYISVLERKKEIGILRALGASKRNISQVFNAETIIVGLLAGLIGVGLTALACPPVSFVAEIMTDVPNVMQLPILAAVVLVCISVLLTFIGGLIPASSASRKDPVEALRSE